MILALAHPGLLWTGAALVSVPVFIHLFFRRRHRVVRWAAMTFLLAALRKHRRRIEVENLLLLLLRCAVILFFALALARPTARAGALGPFGGGARAVVLVVDTSASMGARHAGRTALDRARERAGQLLRRLPSGSRVTLLASRDDAAGGGPRVVIENAAPEEVRPRLAALRPAYGPHALGEVVRAAGRALRSLKGRRLVVFLTDLQRRDWVVTEDTGEAGPVRGARREDLFRALMLLGREEEEDRPPPVAVVDVSPPGSGNVAVEALEAGEGREAFAPSLLWLGASLVNYGPEPAEGTLTLFMATAGAERLEKKESVRVRIPPTLGDGPPARTEVPLNQLLPEGSEGPARFRVRFEPASGAADRLALDNERHLTLRVRPPLRVLPVRTAPAALDILRDMDEAVDVIEFLDPVYPSELGKFDLSRADVVLWADAEIHSLDKEGAANLEAFVRRGGGLLAYLGTYARPARVNELFYKEGGRGLFPMLLEESRMVLDDDHPVRIDVQRAETQAHPLFRDTSKTALFYSPEIVGFRRVRAEFRDDPEFARRHVVARYDTPAGDPAVLEHALGRGRVVILTTTPDERAMRLNGSLLPLVIFFNAAHYLVHEDPALRNVLVGAPVRVPLPPGARRIVVTPPEQAGGRTEEPVEDAARPFVLGDTRAPGFYRFTIQGVRAEGATALPFTEVEVAAVNVDPTEGDLRRITPEELRRLYRRAPLRFAADPREVLPQAVRGGESDMSRALLGAVVGLLFLELLLAWRFGRRRRKAA